MTIRLVNEIQLDQEMEVIEQEFPVQIEEKNGHIYLIFINEEKEKVILKIDEDELLMTRFSKPKSIMRFVKEAEAVVVLPTPLGLQHFVTLTKSYQLDRDSQALFLAYDLKPLESDQLFASYQMTIGWD